MAGRKITRELAEAVIEGFRQRPGCFAAAARHAGISAITAKSYWNKGMVRSPWPEYREPVRDIIAKEKVEARARMETEQVEASRRAAEAEAERMRAVKEQAVKDATDTRVQEASMVRLSRSSSIVLLNNLTTIAAGLAPLGKRVREYLEQRAKGDEPLSVREAHSVTVMVGKLSTALRQANDAAQKALEMERLLLGEPSKIVGLTHLDNVSVAEAKERLAAAQRAMNTLEEVGVSDTDGRPVDPNVH